MRCFYGILLGMVLITVSCNKKDEIKPCVCCPVISWDLSIENQTNIKQDLQVVFTICFVDPDFPRADLFPTQFDIEANATYNSNFNSIGGFDYLLNLYLPLVPDQTSRTLIQRNFTVENNDNIHFVIEVDASGNYSLIQKF